jgi:hypothetical protein
MKGFSRFTVKNALCGTKIGGLADILSVLGKNRTFGFVFFEKKTYFCHLKLQKWPFHLICAIIGDSVPMRQL